MTKENKVEKVIKKKKKVDRDILDSLEAIDFGTKAEKWDIVAGAYSNMGNAQLKSEKYQEAVDSYLKAIDFGTKASDWETVASAYANMGKAQQELEKYQDMVGSYLKAIVLRKFLPDRGERIYPIITQLFCILGVKNIQDKNYIKAEKLAIDLAQVYLDAEKDEMVELIVKTIKAFESKLTKEEINPFQEFKKLYEKSKKKNKTHQERNERN